MSGRGRVRRGKEPLPPYCRIEPPRPTVLVTNPASPPPWLHDRRGHPRHLREGRMVWVKPLKWRDERPKPAAVTFDDQLAELWAAGAILSDIALKLGGSRSVVAGKIARARARELGDRIAPRQYSAPDPQSMYTAPAPIETAPAPQPTQSFRADCVYGTIGKSNAKGIIITIDANDNSASATTGVTTMMATHKQAVDANGAGVGHYIYENDTPTVWYVAPVNSAQYHSAVKLNGKWHPLFLQWFRAPRLNSKAQLEGANEMNPNG
jgi:hypothetical protein